MKLIGSEEKKQEKRKRQTTELGREMESTGGERNKRK